MYKSLVFITIVDTEYYIVYRFITKIIKNLYRNQSTLMEYLNVLFAMTFVQNIFMLIEIFLNFTK